MRNKQTSGTLREQKLTHVQTGENRNSLPSCSHVGYEVRIDIAVTEVGGKAANRKKNVI